MTELQKVEFDILKQFIEICDKLNLQYYLVCGSALGAVKYGGFIPWDDDVDVAMPRKDYEIFLQRAQEFLPKNLFLQNYHTDRCFPAIYSKLRNSNTTYIEKSVAHLPINHGIYIDIFPLDGYPASAVKARILELRKRIQKLKLFCVYEGKWGWKATLLCRVGRLLGWNRNIRKRVEKLDHLLSQYPLKTSKLWCNHGNWQGKLEYAPKWHYGEGQMAQFEGLAVRIPACYESYLEQKYGDYKQNLPKEQQVGHHYYEICDCGRPYTDYM